MTGLVVGGAPEGHHRITYVFVQRALVLEDDARHVGQILVQKQREILSVQPFRNRCEATNVAEHHRDIRLLGLDELRVNQQPPDYFRTQVLSERVANLAPLLVLHEHAVQRHQHHVAGQRHRRNREIQPPSAQEHRVIHQRQRRQQRDAEPHPPRRYQRHPRAQRNAENQNQHKIPQCLLRPAHQKAVARGPFVQRTVQQVVDHVGVNFDAGIVDAAVRRSPLIANSRCRRPHHDNFVFERAVDEFSRGDVRDGVIRIGSARPVIVNLHVPGGIRPHPQLVAKIQTHNSHRSVIYGQLRGIQSEI